ncbi:GIY-YIG nuclease family protein [Microbacterium sp. K2]|uniref:GIY-YIG nuclease family protein n=1 Tax=Microbacterium sp. K2 TaxID=3391827 RepID=UPI003F52805A
MTLHQAIKGVLLERGGPMTTAEIADSINHRGSYRKDNGTPITAFQIHGRTRKYDQWFETEGSTVRLTGTVGASGPLPHVNPIDASALPSPEASSDGSFIGVTLLDQGNFRGAGSIDGTVPNEPGIYAIRMRDAAALPAPFSTHLQTRGHDLLYIGVARRSLNERFLGQELRARGHGTFFRSIGAVLGYRPTAGSLIGMKSPRNFAFAPSDERSIIEWVNQNLLVNWTTVARDHEVIELGLVRQQRPLLNLQGNPGKLPELSALRAECVRIANSA